jgi:CDP-diacylglycerol--serine O-phosphatidyltransferase
VWGILALMMIVAWPQVMIFVIFAVYALSGPLMRAVNLLMKPSGKPVPKTELPALDVKD